MYGLEIYQGAGIKYKGWNDMYGLELDVWAVINCMGIKLITSITM